MAKRKSDDMLLEDWQPPVKRPNSTVQELSPNSNSLVNVNPTLAGLLNEKPIDNSKFFDNFLHYYGSSSGSNSPNIVEKEPNPSKSKPEDDYEGAPNMVLNPKALKRQELLNQQDKKQDEALKRQELLIQQDKAQDKALKRQELLNQQDKASRIKSRLWVPFSNNKKIEDDKENEIRKGQRAIPEPSPFSRTLDLNCCVVDKLVRRFWLFRSLPWKEVDILMFLKAGRPTPEIPNLGVAVNLYKHHDWVTGCPSLGRLYCWPCLLFTYHTTKNQSTTWVKEGFCTLRLLGTSMTKHELSIGHKAAVSTMTRQRLHGTITSQTCKDDSSGTAVAYGSNLQQDKHVSINPIQNPTNKSAQAIQNPQEPPPKAGYFLVSLKNQSAQNQNNCKVFCPETSDLSAADIDQDMSSPLAQQNFLTRIGKNLNRSEYADIMKDLEKKDLTRSRPPAAKPTVESTLKLIEPKPQNEVEIRTVQLQLCLNGMWNGPDEIRDRLLTMGRPKPAMPRLAQQVNGVIKSFSPSCYDIYPWLCGSAELNRLYCWPCILFNKLYNYNTEWNTIGFANIANLKAAAMGHSINQGHMEMSLRMKTFERMRTRKPAFDLKETSKHNAIVRQKKSILKHLIDAVCLKKKHLNNTNIRDEQYTELLQIVSSYNIELKQHLDSTLPNYLGDFTPNFVSTYSPATTKALKIFLKRQIAKEVHDSAFVSFILKSVRYNRAALILRYSKITGEVVERFFKIIKITFGQPEDLLKKVAAQVDWLGCASKFVGISYDGGLLSPQQMVPFNSNLRRIFKAGYFFHNKDEDFSATLQQSLSHSPYGRSFITVLGELGSFLRGNPRVFNLLKRMSPSQQNEWDLTSGIIMTVRHQYTSIMKLLDQIVNRTLAPTAWSNQVVSQCAKFLAFLGLMETRLLLVLFTKVLSNLRPLIEALRGEFDAKHWKATAAEAINSVLKIRSSDFYTMWSTAKKMNLTKERVYDPQGVQPQVLAVFNGILEWILSFIRARTKDVDVWEYFDASTTKTFSPVTRGAVNQTKFQIDLKECFPLFDSVLLGSSLLFTHNHDHFRRKTLLGMLQTMITWDFKSVMPEFYRFLLLLIAVPTTSAHVSRPVSDKIVTYVAGKADVKSADAILYIEKDLLTSAKNETTFYDDVIKIIAELKGTEEFTEINP